MGTISRSRSRSRKIGGASGQSSLATLMSCWGLIYWARSRLRRVTRGSGWVRRSRAVARAGCRACQRGVIGGASRGGSPRLSFTARKIPASCPPSDRCRPGERRDDHHYGNPGCRGRRSIRGRFQLFVSPVSNDPFRSPQLLDVGAGSWRPSRRHGHSSIELVGVSVEIATVLRVTAERFGVRRRREARARWEFVQAREHDGSRTFCSLEKSSDRQATVNESTAAHSLR